MNIPPWKGYDRPRWVPMNKEAISAPQAPYPQGGPQAFLEFQVPPMSQLYFFPLMTSKAFQAYVNFWYAQSQAQAGQRQYLVPLIATFTAFDTSKSQVV